MRGLGTVGGWTDWFLVHWFLSPEVRRANANERTSERTNKTPACANLRYCEPEAMTLDSLRTIAIQSVVEQRIERSEPPSQSSLCNARPSARSFVRPLDLTKQRRLLAANWVEIISHRWVKGATPAITDPRSSGGITLPNSGFKPEVSADFRTDVPSSFTIRGMES